MLTKSDWLWYNICSLSNLRTHKQWSCVYLWQFLHKHSYSSNHKVYAVHSTTNHQISLKMYRFKSTHGLSGRFLLLTSPRCLTSSSVVVDLALRSLVPVLSKEVEAVEDVSEMSSLLLFPAGIVLSQREGVCAMLSPLSVLLHCNFHSTNSPRRTLTTKMTHDWETFCGLTCK